MERSELIPGCMRYWLHGTSYEAIPSYYRAETENYKLLPQKITGSGTKSAQAVGYQDRKVG